MLFGYWVLPLRQISFSFYPQLSQELLTKEVLNYDDVAAILGPCPYGDKRTPAPSQAFTLESTLQSKGSSIKEQNVSNKIF